jgi:perosamine synthetase
MMRKIPVMIPYFSGEETEAVEKVLQSGWVAQGPKVAEFEHMVAEHEGSLYGVATTSCTTALHLALLAMGIGTGDEVLIPSFTFIATANALLYTGAIPVMADIDTATYNISLSSIKQRIEEQYQWEGSYLINNATGNVLKAIIAVNLFGLCANIPAINEIARQYHLLVLEDSACALGAKIGDIHQGGFGNPSCLSFHPRKSITTGEGGMVLSNNDEFAALLATLRSHGASVSEINRHNKGGFLLPDFNMLGYNYRMTDIQAAIGIAQMKKLDWIINERRNRAQIYDKLLSACDWLTAPVAPDGYYHSYQSYVCMLEPEELGFKNIEETNEFRNHLMLALEEIGISTRQGTHAVHTLGYYRDRFSLASEHCINSYRADRLSLTLPLYVQMSEEDQIYVIEQIVNLKKSLKG